MAFVCRHCSKSFADKRNQEYDHDPGSLGPTPDRGTCPDCAEDDDEPESAWRRLN